MSKLNDDVRAALDQGIDLFNDANFFEAHEAWQEARLPAGPERDFLQTLSEVASALHRVQEGVLDGVVKALAGATRRMKDVPGDFLGVDVTALYESTERCRRELTRAHTDYEDEFPDALFPAISRVDSA
jgi:predicted metal-dependent hydrolase